MNARRWTVLLVAVAALALAITAGFVWAGDGDDDDDQASESPSAASSTSDSTSTSTTTTTTTAPSSTTTTTRAPGVPEPVRVVEAGPGGGSQEVAVDWRTTAGATGYKILRSATADGPFAVVADLDVTTGETIAGPEVVNIWSDAHVYIPRDGALSAPDPSAEIHYVDVAGAGRRCFRVVAYDDGGDAPASVAVCGSPP